MSEYLMLVLLFFLISTLFACDSNTSSKEGPEGSIEKIFQERNIDLSTKIDTKDAINFEQIDELKQISTSIIKSHSEGDLENLFNILQKYSPLPEVEFQMAREKSITQLESIRPRFGDYIGYEFINSERVGDSIIRHDCIVKCQNHIIRWEFYYYKPQDKWFLNSFKWDDQIGRIRVTSK